MSISLRHTMVTAARLLLAVLLLGNALLAPNLPGTGSAAASPSSSPVEELLSLETQASYARSIPADLSDLPELVDRRTAQSTVYSAGENHYVALLSSEPLYYQDSEGDWQPIDPAFRALRDSYVVEQNLIQGRAGAQRAWISAVTGEVAFLWQATALRVVDTAGASTVLATALVDPAAFAQQSPAGNALHYAGGWSDPLLSEEIVSTPGNLEQALVFAGPPQFAGPAASPALLEFLEMEATLQLLPGAALWADGRPVSGVVQSAQTLQVRDAQGQTALLLAPVRAFEQARPDISVTGSYAVRPGDEPDTWQVGVRTPWAWWTAHERAYPVVLDPLITVQRSTGWGEGMAWVRSTGDKAYTLGEIRLGAHLPEYNTESRGYVQFNSLPALLANASIQVSAAYLDVEPTDLFIPLYSYKGSGFTDWDSVVLSRKATLAYVGACPYDPACNGFSLQDDTLTSPDYNWDNQPSAVDISTLTLKVGPIKSTGNANPTVTTWDVTAQLQGWYNAWSDQLNPRPGPTFQLRFLDTCPKAGPYVSGFVNGKPQFDSNLVPQCTNFYIPPGKVSLRIEYDELPLSLGANLVNQPGVPSYTPLADSSNNLFLNPNHQYALAQPVAPARWRAVALRGNHNYDEALPTWTTLKLWDYTAVANPGDEPVPLLTAKGQGADTTTFFLIDDHVAGSPYLNADLRAEVVASENNDYNTDQQRNYRLQYVESMPLSPSPLPYSASNQFPINLISEDLITMREFHLIKGDSLGITATVPISVDVALIAPATGAAGALMVASGPQVNLLSPAQPGSDVRTFTLTAPVTGEYALAIINKERPALDPVRPGPTVLSSLFHFLRCSEGSYPTAKYGCQPLFMPGSIVPLPRAVSIPGGGELAVYSQGDFAPGTSGNDWCTTNEGVGAPIIGPDVEGRWVAVVQGSACYHGGILTTTPDSAVALIVATSNPTYGQIMPVPIYGDSMLLPAPDQPDGEVTLVAGGLLQPNADTIKRIMPFQQYWQGYYTHQDDYISTADMQAHGEDTVSTQVTVDAAGSTLPMDWSVQWSLYPYSCPSCPSQWTFVDDPALPSAAFPQEMDLASTTVRMLNGGVPDGEVRVLDTYEKVSGPVAFQFHNTTSRLTVGPLLGGTTKPVHVVIQPPQWPRAAEGQGSCDDDPAPGADGNPTSCLDLRRAEYNWDPLQDAELNVTPWSLPDLHIETLPATVIFSSEGQLNVFSADHPASTEDFAQTFSFDTWEAGVSVAQEKCVPADPVETTVIRGTSFIALPTLGDDGSGPKDTWIKANFRLCQTSLQQAFLEFGIPKPGIPVGSTGVGVHLLNGTVTIDPNSGDTRISLGVGFQTLDGYTLTDGKGTVTLDTAGMLSLQATGMLVGVVSADELRLDVAWNPLDLLFNGQVSYGSGLVSGNVAMHGWIGRGWQGKYSWLDDNDAFHFTGSIAATVRIKSGAVVDDWPFVLPPFTISLTAQVAFGEFCTNAKCTSYDWGMSATVKVLGYSVGVYVDSGGPDLILGSNSHKLIDQAGGVPDMATRAVDSPLLEPVLYPGTNQLDLTPPFSSPFDGVTPDHAATACTGVGTPVVECPFVVNPGVGRALFTISWENGNLAPVLVKPNNTVIDPINAPDYGVLYNTQPPGLVQVASYSVVTPTTGLAIDAGTWHVRLSNVGVGLLPGFQNNYNLLFAADPPAATLAWSAPQDLSPTQKRLLWTASRGGQALSPDLEAELFAIAAGQQPITPTLMAGTTIVQKISANNGQYDWDLSGLGAGTYAFGARLDDHATGNGHVVVWSPYTVTLVDSTPPPVPALAGKLAYTDTLIIYWFRDDTTPDLAGYLVEYTVPDWDLTNSIQHVRRILPSKKSESPIFERTRLGGLFLSGPQVINTTVCVRAYDASGNVSDCTPTTYEMPESPEVRLGPPEDIRLGSDGSSITAAWIPPGARDLGGSLVGYRPVGCLLERAQRSASEGPSPLMYRPTIMSTELTGLTPGQVYEVSVAGYRTGGEIGPRISARVMHIDPTDANADGIPDQWAAVYGLDPDFTDLDGDGLSDRNEYEAASDPRKADSDGDGAYDSQEVEAGTDPCDPNDRPQSESPRLALMGDASLFLATATNLGAPEPQFISIFNRGGATLAWEAGASEPWITLSPARGSGIGTVGIYVNPAGLAPGLYTGLVTISSSSPAADLQAGLLALSESVDIPVTMLVLPLKEHNVYLPYVQR